MISSGQIVAEARTWLGVPFRHQGRSRLGVDCIGLVICVRNACEELPELVAETRSYTRRPVDGLLLRKVADYCTELPEPEAGALVVMRWRGQKEPSHVAICSGDTIIHSYMQIRRVCEVGYREPWLRLTHSIWRMPGVSP